jgi:hypothetical protein
MNQSEYFRSEQFQEDFRKQVEKDTWDNGLPMVYLNEEGDIVRHYKDGKIEIIKEKKMKGILTRNEEGVWMVKWSDLHSFGHGTHWMYTELSNDSNIIKYVKDDEVRYNVQWLF